MNIENKTHITLGVAILAAIVVIVPDAVNLRTQILLVTLSVLCFIKVLDYSSKN